jgi:phenylacetate-CoA ligase
MLLRAAAYVPLVLARQYGTTAGLRRLQLRQLNAMLAHARRRVPFYRDRPAYHRRALRSLAELAELPLLSKPEVRELPQWRLLADGVDPDRCQRFTTSGTTGHRLVVLHDRGNCDYQNAAMVRRFLATGRYLPTHRLSHLRPTPSDSWGFQRLGLFRRQIVYTSEPVERWAGLLRQNRPRVLMGYPVHARELLRHLSDHELFQLRRDLRMVMTDSELLVDEQRAAITTGFGVPVFDEYSSFETLHIYYECPRGGRHIAEDRVYVEVVDDDGNRVPDGVEGRIVCTAFHERAMPLLRYVMGDIGVIDPEPCGCGRRFRTMRVTRGRMNDSVLLPDGSRMFADRFIAIVLLHPGVAGLFVRQDATGAVRVHVAPDGAVPVADLLASVEAVVRREAGHDLDLEVVQVDEVPLTPGGKAKFVQSDYQPA